MRTCTINAQVAAIKEASAVIGRLTEWLDLSDAEMRLRCGEMTAQEIRTVKVVLRAIVGEKS